MQESPTGESALTLPWSHNPYATGSAMAHEDSAEQHFDYDNSPVKIRVQPAFIAETYKTPTVSTCEPPPGSSVCGGVTIAPDAGHQQLSTSAASATQLPKCCSQVKESETESMFGSAFAPANYWSSLDATNALATATARQDTTVSEAGESVHEIDRESLPAPVTYGATFNGGQPPRDIGTQRRLSAADSSCPHVPGNTSALKFLDMLIHTSGLIGGTIALRRKCELKVYV